VPDAFATESAALPATTAARRPRRWLRWVLGGLVVLLVLAAVALQLLDPWLRRTLEKQVARQTHGQYQLRVKELHTSLLQRAIRLQGVRLRPAVQLADTLPRLRLDAARLHVTGVGLLALLRKGVVPIDSVVLDSARIELLALPRRPTRNAGKPLHQQLPLHLKGVEIDYVGLLHTQASYLPGTSAAAAAKQLSVSGLNLLISSAGAADTQRLAYAQNWALAVRQAQAQMQGHQVHLAAGQAITVKGWLQLDSVRVQPVGTQPPQVPRVQLALEQLRLSGLQAAALLHQHRFRADSLRLRSPHLNLVLASTQAARPNGASTLLQAFDLQQVTMQNGEVQVRKAATAATLRKVELQGTGLHYQSGAAAKTGQVLFADAWTLGLGNSQGTVGGHTVALRSLHLATAPGTLGLNALRIVPPAPGKGQPGAVEVDLTLPSLALRGLDASKLQSQRQLRAASLVLNAPRLKVKPPAQAPPPVWKLLASVAQRTDLQLLRVRNAHVEVGGLRHAPEANHLNLTGKGIRIDSLAAQEPRRIAYARAWQATAGPLALPFDPPYYHGTSQRLQLDTDARSLTLETLALTPKYSVVQMNLHKGYQVPSLSLRIAALLMRGVDFAALARHTDIRVQRLTVQRPVLRISSDGRGPINPHQSLLTPESFLKLPLVVDVRRLDIANGNIYSRYRSPLTPLVGTLSINRFNSSFLNLSNDPARQTAATPLTGRATLYLQNQARLDAQLSAYLLDPQGRHRVWGSFGAGPLAMLNSMTVPTRLVKFKSGEVHRLRFDLRADRRQVTGMAWTEYSGLQLQLLGYKDEEVKRPLLKRVLSKAANVVVIRDQNPRKGGKLVSGDMTSTREPRFSVFTLWRQGLVSGLFNNMGVPQKLAQKLSEKKDEAPLPK